MGQIAKILDEARRVESDLVGFTCSSFDLLHAGHILMLQECKQQCGYLIVGLQVDPTIDRPGTKNKPVQSIVERYIQLDAVECVDSIIVYNTEEDLEDLLRILPISVRFLGPEYEGAPFTGDGLCKELGISILHNRRTHGWSTTELRKRIADTHENRERLQAVASKILET